MIEYKFESYALFGSSVLIAGLLRLYFFFKSFNISILPYIELQELTTLALDNIIFFSIFVILNISIFSFFYKKRNVNKGRFERLKKQGFFHFDKIIIFIIILPILFIIQQNTQKVFLYEFVLWTILLFVGIYLNPFIYFESQQFLEKKNIKINMMTMVFFISALNLCFFSSISGISEAYKIKLTNYYYGSKFELDNQEIILSNSKKYFIGKSKAYLFFYEPEDEITQIVPVSRVRNIELKK